jgi:hypothetical protein
MTHTDANVTPPPADDWATPRAELIAAVASFMGVSATDVINAHADVMDTDDADIKAGGNALCIAIRAAYSGDDDYDELGHELEHVLNLCDRTEDDMCVMLDDEN